MEQIPVESGLPRGDEDDAVRADGKQRRDPADDAQRRTRQQVLEPAQL
jgi:hypothetical protein